MKIKYHLMHLSNVFSVNKRKNAHTISKEEYQELRVYATRQNVKLSGFKHFVGDISLIKELVDDIMEIAKDFPLITQGRKTVEIVLDDSSKEDDFATTVDHVIYINSNLFSDLAYLDSEYTLAVEQGKFVKGTNYRSVIRHELGHVVSYKYRINSMDIAKKILDTQSKTKVLDYVRKNLSFYSAECSDGSEIISESFSAYYGNTNNEFADKFIKECLKKGAML